MPAALETKSSRQWVGWAVVAVAAATVAISFAFSPGDEDGTQKPGEGPRVAPVSVAAVTRASITEWGRYPGELDADTADVSSFYAGRLVAVRVRVGDTVESGDVLAELDPVDAKEQIAQAQAQARAAAAEEKRTKVERDAADAELVRSQALVKDQLITAAELDRQRARAQALGAAVESAAASGAEARARVRLLEKRIVESVVRAPFAGRIAARYVDPGTIVSAGAPLVRVVQVAPLRIRFEVPQHDVTGLSAGSRVRVVIRDQATTTAGPEGAAGAADAAPPANLTASPDAAVHASVTGIASEVSRDRRVVSVEALVEAPPAGWLPGMYAEAVVVRRTIDQATVVPEVAVLSRLQPSGTVDRGVFVATDGVARWAPVVVTAREGDRVAVDASLVPGAQVLISGHADLTDGARVKVAGEPPPATGVR